MHGPNLKNGTHSTPTELARPVNIPPRPALLIALQHEIATEDPYLKKIVHLVNRDVAIAGNLLAMANSAMFNLNRHIETVEEAITLIGLNNCHALITRLMARRMLSHGKMMMPRFWDVSEKRSWGMMHVARQVTSVAPDLAYNFGLFCDIGIPLMMASFLDYEDTLTVANQLEHRGFVELENSRHGINHALVGAMLAEHWHADPLVVLAIKKHHSYEIMSDPAFVPAIHELIAIFCLVDQAIQQHRHAVSIEWLEGGEMATETLGLTAAEADDLCEELRIRFLSPNMG
ncbi:HDOD domain-containing protein [Herminiimonas fonticola]|uniref:HDOD domain-containing protein n=1 Tax=Herminiimonas fonticola TaxID=303380 RepID=UPI00333E71A6